MIKKSFLALCLLTIATTSAFSEHLVSPASGSIKVLGRVDASNPQRLKFDNPGVNFTIKFTASSTIAVRFKGSPQTFFQAFVNEKPTLDASGKQAIFTSINDTTVVIASNLSKKQTYEVTLFKRTENLDNIPAEFMGFVIDDGGKALDAAPLYKQRRFEFLGNSITCAFGSESKNKDSKFAPYTENNNLSYAHIIARAFNADVQLVARSGRGVVRNYNDKDMLSTKYATTPKLFSRTFDSDSTILWDFKKYTPDAVVVNLGTNDYSTTPHPYKSLFIDGYLKLIAKIRAAYGSETKIFCVAGPMIDEPCYSYVKEMVDIQRQVGRDANIFFIGLPKALLSLDKDFGAAAHPGGDGQKKMAQMVAPVISTVMGWDYSRSEMDDLKGSQDYYSREK